MVMLSPSCTRAIRPPVGFRRHVADHHAPGAAREAAVGDQAHALAQALADQRAGGRQHLGHARAALGAQVAQHHHVAGLDLAGHDGGQRALLVVEHTRRAGDDRVLQAGDLGHAAFGAQVALEDGQVALGVHRVGQTGRITSWSARSGGTSARFCATVLPVMVMQSPCSRPGVQQHLHHGRDAAGAVQVDGQVLAAGLQVAQHRGLAAHALEVVDGPFHARPRGRWPGSAAPRWC
jgi:hypothetical protein